METHDKIKQHLRDKGIKRMYLHEKTGLSCAALTLLLNGKKRLLLKDYLAICHALDVSPMFYLICEKIFRKLLTNVFAMCYDEVR